MKRDKTNYSIMIIEDNPGDYTLIEDYLQEQILDPHITHVKNFKEAKLFLTNQQNHYDTILLDLSLPDMDGEKLIVEIISLCTGCAVIVLTGFTDIEFSIKSLSLGVADYLLKEDINATSLYKSIIYNIERRKSNVELKESQKRYSNLFQLSPQPMWVYDPETLRFLQVNNAAIEHYGYSKEEFLSMTMMNIIPGEDAGKLKQLINKKISGKGNLKSSRFRHYKKSKELIEVEVYSTPIMIDNKLYSSVIAIDITEKLLMEQELLEQQVEEQMNITRAVVNAQEKERAGIGEELHDNVNQLLAASKLYLNHSLSKPGNNSEFIIKSQEYISTAMDELRKLSHALVGPTQDETLGLINSLEKLIENISIIKDIKISFIHSSYNEKESDVGFKLVIYRIIQEQFNNILKHAEASEVEIELKKEAKNLIIVINDNGKGFDSSLKMDGIGIRNIKNRALIYNGAVEIISSPGNGCEMKVTFKNQKIKSDKTDMKLTN
ncbi:MAG TPA: PAS domain S-box protein [Chitinophagaceae bacterium]|nr:PAS domain S-box protein [Chitinophagaceae bacterium]